LHPYEASNRPGQAPPPGRPSAGGARTEYLPEAAVRWSIVHVNDQTLNNDAYAPFGGTGASGNGSRFGSQSSWDEFTQWQWLTLRDQAHGFPF
jgi:acyl-CoA reductase-like NAD-dependent aldehyde dehydrogenase